MMNKTIGSVYVHIPFCRKKCSYCDFRSTDSLPELAEAYADALLAEADNSRDLVTGKIQTLFIGGGTPVALPPFLFEKILHGLCQRFSFEKDYEFTVEANPESLSAEHLQIMQQYGVNRLSIGVQSTDPQTLQLLGRVHTAQKAQQALVLAREYGISRISLDLMYGVPGQTLDSWKETLEQIIGWNPEHLSLYQLKIEENTGLYQQWESGQLQEFCDQQAEQMCHYHNQRLETAGYRQYEVSNYARPGYECRHNLTYWNYRPYLGLGWGAVSFYQNCRREMAGTLKEYCRTNNFADRDRYRYEKLSPNEMISEYLIMNLRLTDGFRLSDFEQRFGISFLEKYRKQIAKLIEKNWLSVSGQRVMITAQGRLLANFVFEEFIE